MQLDAILPPSRCAEVEADPIHRNAEMGLVTAKRSESQSCKTHTRTHAHTPTHTLTHTHVYKYIYIYTDIYLRAQFNIKTKQW